MIQRDESIPEHIDTLLDALTNANAKQPDDNQTTADIVTWRGIMTKLLCTPYSRKEPWELRATKYNVKTILLQHAPPLMQFSIGNHLHGRASNREKEEFREPSV